MAVAVVLDAVAAADDLGLPGGVGRDAHAPQHKGLDERLKHETGMPILIADDPLDSVAVASGKCVEEFEAPQQVLISEPRR